MSPDLRFREVIEDEFVTCFAHVSILGSRLCDEESSETS
jgi:hypothetical protein